MRRIKRKIKTDLSILLILAMLFGCIPQNTLMVQATEPEERIENQMEEEIQPVSLADSSLVEIEESTADETKEEETEESLIPESEDLEANQPEEENQESREDSEEGSTESEVGTKTEEGTESESNPREEESLESEDDLEESSKDEIPSTTVEEEEKEINNEIEETEQEEDSLSENDVKEEVKEESLSDNSMMLLGNEPEMSVLYEEHYLSVGVQLSGANYLELDNEYEYMDWVSIEGLDNSSIYYNYYDGYYSEDQLTFEVFLEEDLIPEYYGLLDISFYNRSVADSVVYNEETNSYTVTVDLSNRYDRTVWINLGIERLNKGEEKIVKFNDKASKVSYKVWSLSGNGLKVKTDEYKLREGENIFEFEIKEEPPYEAEVTIEPQAEIARIADYGNTKTYYLINKSLETNTNITITQKEVGYKDYPVRFSLDNTKVSYKLSIDGEYVEPDEIDDTDYSDTITYMVPYGKEVQVEVSNLNPQFYEITSAYVGTSGEKALFSKSDKSIREGFSYSFQVKNNVSVNVRGENKYSVSLIDENNNPVVSEGNVFSVRPDTYYTFKMFDADNQVDIANWSLGIISKLQDSENTIFEVRSSYNGWMEGSLYISSKEAGKEIEIQLSDAYYGSKQTIKLKVQPNLTKVTLTGAKSGKITVEEYSTQVFPIVTTPANANTENLNFYIETEDDASDFYIELSEDKKSLIVKSTGQKNKGNVIITFVDEVVKDIEYGKFTLSATDSKIKSVTPKVELINATDKSLNLKLSASGIQTSDYQYEIIAVAKSKEGGIYPDGVIPRYYTEYLDYDPKLPYQEIEVNVQENLAYNYNVKVVLLFKTDDEIRSKSVIKVFSTLPASYETALKLKKGAGTVYTGQEDVVIATAQFSNTTTYRSIQKLDFTMDNGNIHVMSDDKNNVLVTAQAGAKPGKYVVNVKPYAPSTMKTTAASIIFTIERGIEELEIQTPSKLYKENKKAASLTPVLEYNASYGTAANAQPKLKKVEWSIVKNDQGEPFEANHPIVKYVSVNKTTGKVSVDKNYILQKGDSSFYLMATAVDFARAEGSEVVGISEEITITNKKIEPGQVLLVEKWGSLSEPLNIISEGNETISPKDMKDTQIVVVEKGVVGEEGVLTANDCLPTDLVKFTTTAKNFKIDPKGVIYDYDYKTAKNITLTATTTDGGSVKAALTKLNIGYEEAADYRLAVKTYVDLKGTQEKILSYGLEEEKEFNFSGPKDTVLKVSVMEKEASVWKSLIGQANYTLSVTGGKIVSQNLRDNSYTIVANKKTVNISIKYKDSANKQQEVKYTFVNEAVSEAKSPSIKANNKIYSAYGISTGQFVSLSLPKGTVVDGGNITHAYITLDNATADKSPNYSIIDNNLCEALNKNTLLTGDEILLKFNTLSSPTQLKKGDIKLNIELGNMQGDKFVSQMGTATVTIKAEDYKMPSAKINPNYTISLKDSPKVLLTLNNKNVDNNTLYVDTQSLRNDNVKGKENKFWEYFELESVPQEGCYLRLQENADISKITSDDLTGWILTYGFAGGLNSEPAQIKVTLKDVSTKKYTNPVVTIDLEKAYQGGVPIMVGQQIIPVSKVYVDNPNVTGRVDADGVILTVENEEALKASNTITLYVISKDSFYKDKEINDRSSAIKYGEKITVTLKILK